MRSSPRRWGRGERRYDGRFTFVRLRWAADFSTGRRAFGFGSNAGNHDFPRAEQNLMLLLLRFREYLLKGGLVISTTSSTW